MPNPGDQHARGIVNPFEEQRPRINQYTADEIELLQSRLERKLGPEYISERAGPGGTRVHYIAAEKVIALANEVFGFNGWSSSIQNIQVDFVDEHPQTLRVTLGLSVIVRVTLRDGTYHEDIGYGHVENFKGKAAAFDKAKKEGTTDALKRALKNFGNVLGNCIKDKEYVRRVTKIKVPPTRFEEADLHRHPDYVKALPPPAAAPAAAQVAAAPAAGVLALAESASKDSRGSSVDDELLADAISADSFDDLLGDIDEADLCVPGDGHPDEIAIDTTVLGNSGSSNGPQSNGSNPPANHAIQNQRSFAQNNGGNQNNTGANANGNNRMQPPSRPLSRVSSGNMASAPSRPQPNQAQVQTPVQRPNGARPMQPPPNHAQRQGQESTNTNSAGVPPQPAPGAEPIGFFSARAVNALAPGAAGVEAAAKSLAAAAPQGQHAFNPKFDSPSLRRTPGIDHSSSRPVSRRGYHVAPAIKDDNNNDGGGSGSGGAGAGTTTTAAAAAPPAPPPHQGSFQRHHPQRGPANVLNPSLDSGRRIGVPGAMAGGASPLAGRSTSGYRPPTMKRPYPGAGAAQAQGQQRAAMAEVNPNLGVGQGGGGDGAEAKRMRTS